jgi:hypothetical protein
MSGAAGGEIIMTRLNSTRGLLKAGLQAGAAITALMAAPAFAQDAPAGATNA